MAATVAKVTVSPAAHGNATLSLKLKINQVPWASTEQGCYKGSDVRLSYDESR